MPEKELIHIGASSSIGTFIGAFMSAMAFKWRLGAIEKRQDSLSKDVVHKDVCSECKSGHNKEVGSVQEMLKEVRLDVKKLLERRTASRD